MINRSSVEAQGKPILCSKKSDMLMLMVDAKKPVWRIRFSAFPGTSGFPR